MHPKDAEGIANSVDPDQTAGSALFAKTCLSENLGKLRYIRYAYELLLSDLHRKTNTVNWASEVKDLLSSLGFYEIWLTQGVGNKNMFLSELKLRLNGPRQANLVLIAYASSEGSGEPAHPCSLARTFAARSYKQ